MLCLTFHLALQLLWIHCIVENPVCGNQMDVHDAMAVNEPVKDNKKTGENDCVCYYAVTMQSNDHSSMLRDNHMNAPTLWIPHMVAFFGMKRWVLYC